MKPMLRSILFGGYSLPSLRADVGDLVLRGFAGLSLALAHGAAKLDAARFQDFVGGVEKLGFPVPTFFAWAAVLSEFAGGLLLAAGLLTRPAAFLIACTMAVAAFRVHAGDPYSVRELALVYLAIAICYLLKGTGRLSVDHVIRTTMTGESRGFDTH
jgi:putative oxidoreductase